MYFAAEYTASSARFAPGAALERLLMKAAKVLIASGRRIHVRTADWAGAPSRSA